MFVAPSELSWCWLDKRCLWIQRKSSYAVFQLSELLWLWALNWVFLFEAVSVTTVVSKKETRPSKWHGQFSEGSCWEISQLPKLTDLELWGRPSEELGKNVDGSQKSVASSHAQVQCALAPSSSELLISWNNIGWGGEERKCSHLLSLPVLCCWLYRWAFILSTDQFSSVPQVLMTLLENSHGAQASSNSSLGRRSGMEMREQGMERSEEHTSQKESGGKKYNQKPCSEQGRFFSRSRSQVLFEILEGLLCFVNILYFLSLKAWQSLYELDTGSL